MERARRRRTGLTLTVSLFAIGVFLAALVVPALGRAAPWSPPSAVYFPQTGHELRGDFLTYWREHGRATLLGYPLTGQMTQGGLTIQYFQYARLERQPDGTFQFGALGSELLAARARRQLVWSQQGGGRLLRGGDTAEQDAFARLPFALFANDPNDHRFFPESGHTLSNSFLLFWETNGGLARFGYPLSEEFRELSPIDGSVYATQYFERARFEYHPGVAANFSVVLTPLGGTVAREQGIDTNATARPAGVPDYAEALFAPPPTPTATSAPAVNVNRPSSVPAGRKWIDVNLSRQYLIAYEGDTVVWNGYMSSGRRGHETPTGTYSIFSKLTVQDMRGPDPTLPGGYYFQPEVPWVMYFADGGYAIHGVYWHNNFGAPMSHGCVGLPVSAAGFIYNWAPLGTLVYVHY